MYLRDMSKINTDSVTKKSVEDFVHNDFVTTPKPIIFWDTCAFLNNIRFIYRECEDAARTINAINTFQAKIINGEIYSVASNIEINEWNDNIDITLSEFQANLEQTTKYHKDATTVIYAINGSEYATESIADKGLAHALMTIAKSIAENTIYLLEDDSIAYNALHRTKEKNPPAGVKNEFKDCVIWETMLRLSEQVEMVDSSKCRVFYTANFKDFCEANNPKKVLYFLKSEAITKNFTCCVDVVTAASLL